MTKNIRQWTYHAVTEFLKKNDFDYYDSHRGSNQIWVKLAEDGTPDRIVEVRFTDAPYPPKILTALIHQSGVPESEWAAWFDA